MAIDRARAAREEPKKAALEASLARDRARTRRELVRDAARQFAELGAASIEERSRELTLADLERHYARVAPEFDDATEQAIPAELALTDEERAGLREALAGALASRAREQASRIARTDQVDAAFGRDVAEAERARAAQADGRALGSREFALVAAGAMEARMRGRGASIASFETQAPAELAKAAEVRALLGLAPVAAPGAAELSVLKEWVSQGDSRVRPPHAQADGQRVRSNQPFEVGGERLMQPGDTSLGASLPNVVGCRCSAAYDSDQVAAERRRLTG